MGGIGVTRRRALAGGVSAVLLAAAMAASDAGCSAGEAGGAFPASDSGVGQGDAATISNGDGGLPTFDGSSAEDSGGGGADGAAEADGAFGDAGFTGPTTLLVVHASANLFPFRVCFGGGTSTTPPTGLLALPAYPDDPAQPMPQTNIPGVPVGGAATLPPLAISGQLVTPYVIPADKLDDGTVNVTTCDKLFCNANIHTSCLAKGDYAALPSLVLPAVPNTVLAVQGCLPQALADIPGSVAQCGASYDAAMGNLSATASSALYSFGGGLALQTAQLSPSFGTDDAGALEYVDPTLDASVNVPFSAFTNVPFSDAGIFSASFVIVQGSGATITQSLSSIQYFQSTTSDPTTYFHQTSRYFTAVVGDATDAAAQPTFLDGAVNPAFDGHGLHVIAYPAN